MFEGQMFSETTVAMVLKVHDEKLSLGCKMLQVRLVKDPNDLMCIYVFCSVQASWQHSSSSQRFALAIYQSYGTNEGNEGDEGHEGDESNEGDEGDESNEIDEEGRWGGGTRDEGHEGDESDEGHEGDEGHEVKDPPFYDQTL